MYNQFFVKTSEQFEFSLPLYFATVESLMVKSLYLYLIPNH